MFNVINIDHIAGIQNNLNTYLKTKPRDCILYSEDGAEFKIHKELFTHTKFMRNILESAKEHCCGKLEIICPCDKEDLSHLVHFLYDGEIHCNEEFDSIRILDNLAKIFGFPKNLRSFCYSNLEINDFFVEDDQLYASNAENRDSIIGSNTVLILPIHESMTKNVEEIEEEIGPEQTLKHKSETEKVMKKKISRKFVCDSVTESISDSLVNKPKKISKSNLKRKKYQCNQCQKTFSYDKNLRAHKNMVHLKIRHFQCAICNDYFSTKLALQKHVNTKHPFNKIRLFKCGHCVAAFKNKAQLHTHHTEVHGLLKNRNK